MFMYMPFGVQSAYKGDEKAFAAEAFRQAENKKPAHKAAPLAPIAPMLLQAEKHWNGGQVSRVTVNNPGDANATIQLTREAETKLSSTRQSMQFDGVSGAFISSIGDETSTAVEARGVLYGLSLIHI